MYKKILFEIQNYFLGNQIRAIMTQQIITIIIETGRQNAM